MKPSALLLLLGVPGCLTLGYFLGVPSLGNFSRTGEPISPLARASESIHKLSGIRAMPDPIDRRLALLSLIENADADGLELLFTSARLSDDLTARNAAAQRWSELDPAGFQKHLKSLPADEMEEITEVASILFRNWARADPETAMAMAKKAESLPGFGGVRGLVIAGVLQHNPEKGMVLAAGEKNLWMNQVIDKEVWEKDPARFVKAVGINGRFRMYSEFGFDMGLEGARREALTVWMEKDLAGALEWAATLPLEARAELMPGMLGKLAGTDLGRARQIFESLTPSSAREAVGPSIVAQWAKTDPQGALDWIEEKMTGGRGMAYQAWINAIAGTSPAEAARFLEALPEGNGRDQATRALAETWAQQDLPGALGWIRNLADPGGRRDAYASILFSWAEKDGDGLREFIAKAPFEELPKEYPYKTRYSTDRIEQDKQVLWAAGLPVDRRDRIFDNAVQQAASNRSAAQIVELINKVKEPELQESAGSRILNHLLQSDSDKAVELITAFPAGMFTEAKRAEVAEAIKNSLGIAEHQKQILIAKLK